jgi:hypothetical protein
MIPSVAFVLSLAVSFCKISFFALIILPAILESHKKLSD